MRLIVKIDLIKEQYLFCVNDVKPEMNLEGKGFVGDRTNDETCGGAATDGSINVRDILNVRTVCD